MKGRAWKGQAVIFTIFFLVRKKLKNVFRFFERWVRCEGLPFFVCGAVGKLR